MVVKLHVKKELKYIYKALRKQRVFFPPPIFWHPTALPENSRRLTCSNMLVLGSFHFIKKKIKKNDFVILIKRTSHHPHWKAGGWISRQHHPHCDYDRCKNQLNGKWKCVLSWRTPFSQDGSKKALEIHEKTDFLYFPVRTVAREVNIWIINV